MGIALHVDVDQCVLNVCVMAVQRPGRLPAAGVSLSWGHRDTDKTWKVEHAYPCPTVMEDEQSAPVARHWVYV